VEVGVGVADDVIVGVGVLVNVRVGVWVEVEVMVGVKVIVADGVVVGPNKLPEAQAVIIKLIIIIMIDEK
jgi:hypothetical protein